MTNDTQYHKFEAAGLGRAPFRFVGHEHRTYQACPGAPIQVGGSCDYCGTGISDFYWIQDADGKRFKVGCECVKKLGDKGLVKQVAEAKRKVDREKRHARERVRLDELDALLDEGGIEAELLEHPHPMADSGAFFASLTLLDWVGYMMQNAGTSGRLRVLTKLRKVRKAARQ